MFAVTSGRAVLVSLEIGKGGRQILSRITRWN
jgi:hypothetical protein